MMAGEKVSVVVFFWEKKVVFSIYKVNQHKMNLFRYVYK
jgi:hypothetical protein